MENNVSQPTAQQDIDYALMAQKSHLRTEEKWIEDALTIIKRQWNSLQVERLEIESNIATLRKAAASSHRPTSQATDIETIIVTQHREHSNLDTVPICEILNLNVPGYFNNNHNETLNSFALMEEEEEEGYTDEEDFDVNLDMCVSMTGEEHR